MHSTETPLHLAFSCYVFDEAGRLLLTRRAVTKRTWPGVWTNSFCGHPRPGEESSDALHRYARHELGLAVQEPVCLLPSFRYRAVDAGGMVENELCPVYAVRCSDDPVLNPDEVVESRWVELADLRTAVTAAPWALSPWLLAAGRGHRGRGRMDHRAGLRDPGRPATAPTATATPAVDHPATTSTT